MTVYSDKCYVASNTEVWCHAQQVPFLYTDLDGERPLIGLNGQYIASGNMPRKPGLSVYIPYGCST